MIEQEKPRSRLLEIYGKFNRLTLAGFLGFAGVAAFVAPHLVIPALSLAVIDAGQVMVIDRINKKKNSSRKQVVYEAQKPPSNVIFVDFKRRRSQQSRMAA
ncbi:MAG: hypothetical protein HY344_00795 [Candidatus Levybacteria bacterium]|nr:hypothetical protein [Candidatus Levybacteria bacterium]